MATEGYDAIVLGVGGVGAAATYHLAERGADVLGLERFDVGHERGSSHGRARLIRLAYHEGESYVPLLRRTYRNWRALETRTGRDLLTVTGSLAVGPPDSETFRDALATCRDHDLEHAVLDVAAVNDRFPAYDLPAGEEYRALWQPDGGFLRPEACVTAHVEAAFDAGAEVRARERVESWESTESGVRVETDRDSYTAGTLVVTAGPWAGEFVDGLDDHLTVERHVTAWFRPEEPSAFDPSRFPVFTMDAAEGHFYGVPEHGALGFKVGDDRAVAVDPDEFDREPTREDERPIRAFVERYFSGGAGPTLRLNRCPVTQSPDGHYVVDTLPGDGNVVVGAGFSGHGFKLSAAVGDVLADLALDGETAFDIDRFAVDRFD